MKNIFGTIAVALALSVSAAQAQTAPTPSPARQLYDQAAFYLEFNYWGFSDKDLATVIQNFSGELEVACKSDTNCPFETATPLIQKLTAAVGDDHTGFYTPAQVKALTGQLSGQGNATPRPIWGFNFSANVAGRSLRVFDVLPGSSAEKAGMKYGDTITGFNGGNFGETPETLLTEFAATNAKGGDVTLSITRNGQKIEITGRPAIYQNLELPWLETISRADNKKVMRLRVPSFTNPNTGQRLNDLASQAQAEQPSKLLIDLRDNGGGLATECLSGVAPFIGGIVERLASQRRSTSLNRIEAGRITFTNTETKNTRLVKTVTPGSYSGALSVLINSRSASCAEYFASDIKFAARGAIVGTESSGVGNTGTQILPLLDGSAVQITVQKALRVDGSAYPARVTPTVLTPDDRATVYAIGGPDTILEAGITN